MATVKLNADRTRGGEEYAAGDLYSCSDAEAAALIEAGYASETKGQPKAEPVVAEPEAAEPAEEPAPKKKKG